MNHYKVAEALHRTAGVLLDLANELQENIGSTRRPVSGSSATSHHEMVARQIQDFWQGVTASPHLSIGSVLIDLSTKEGKRDLLVIALLRGARVTEEVVEATFNQLKGEGLLSSDRLLTKDSRAKQSIRRIFEKTYKALGHREAKVEALFDNAQLLQSAWDGDLQKLYETASGDDELIGALQQFRQINRMAYWICRTMYIHGIWPKVGPDARRYVDRPVRLPLQRLGIIDPMDSTSGFRHSVEEVDQAVGKWFAGDVVPLYLHGSQLCVKDDLNVCLAKCPVSTWCAFSKRP